jgi:hypothetical protein
MGDRFGQIRNHLRTPLENVSVLPLTAQAEKKNRQNKKHKEEI